MANWTNLFGSATDYECQDCMSVFSPASYLVDIMQYLDNCPRNPKGQSPLQVLFERRPDIGNLLLTCANTNTEIPYIDLANEVMEYYVANKIGPGMTSGDTGDATAEELMAEPQYILMDAYTATYAQVYPFNLPYHQPLDVIRSYLTFLQTNRAELMEVFYNVVDNTKSPPTVTGIPSGAVDAEWLQLSLMEYEILTGQDFSGASNPPKPNVEDYFGGPTPAYTGKGIWVSDLLQRTGLQYTELLTILETQFINPGQNALNVLQALIAQAGSPKAQTLYNELKGNTWQTDSSFTTELHNNNVAQSDFMQWLTTNFQLFQQVITLYEATSDGNLDATYLHSIQCIYETPPTDSPGSPAVDANINTSFLSKLHRFIRLWRKTGWTIHELDNMISALGETDITPTLIHKLAVLIQINATLDLPLLKLACLWGNIDTYGDNSPDVPVESLYAQLFLKQTGNVTSNGVALQNAFAPNPLNEILTVSPAPQMADYLPDICAALSLSADEYDAITNDAVIDGTLTSQSLSVGNLSLIYRYKLLASQLNLSAQDLCTLKSATCFNVNPFADPDKAFTFIQNVGALQLSTFSVPVLTYVLSGVAKDIDNIALTQDQIFQMISALRISAAQIASSTADAASQNQAQVPQVVAAISALIDVDVPVLGPVIKADVQTLVQAICDFGLTGAYYNNATFNGAVALTRTDPGINFAWGTASPDPTVAANNFSVRWTGWFSPPADGDYTFFISIGGMNETAAIWVDGVRVFSLNRADFADTIAATSASSTVPSLIGGKVYSITVEYVEISGTARIQLSWKSTTMPQAVMDSSFLFPSTDVQTFLTKMPLYQRAGLFINGFVLNVDEVTYFTNNPVDFSNINFLSLTCDHWLRMFDYTKLRSIIPANLLLGVFQQAVAEDESDPGKLPSDALITNIANANAPGWNEGYVSYLAGDKDVSTPSYYQYAARDFRNEIALLQIQKAMDLAIKTKMQISATGLPSWTVVETDAAHSVGDLHPIAEQVKNAVKAKYSDNWLTIATQLNNPIRENQRQALISYLVTMNLVLPEPPAPTPVTDADSLYEYLLIDVQTTSAVATSRLIQATMAVQLFADRCLLGLETEVLPGAINPDEWDWLKHYSVAAGLKKLFVFVENYLDPSLRDDKSPFFEDFESALKKGDITADNVENAFRDYLHKLNEVSNMEVCGMYNDDSTETLYVFARTHSAPYDYYYRTASALASQNAWTWAPWEQVQLDIKSIDDADDSGVHLMPTIWKGRLFLFWPEFMQKTEKSSNNSSTYQQIGNNTSPDQNTPQQYWEVRLAWSEYVNGKWTPKQLSKETLTPLMGVTYVTTPIAPTEPKQYFLRPSIDQNDVLTVALYFRYAGQTTWSDWPSSLTDDAIPIEAFILTDIHEKIQTKQYFWQFPWPDDHYFYPQDEINSDYLIDGPDIFSADPDVYDPFFQSVVKDNTLTIDGTEFLQNTITFKLLFSNDVSIPDWENNINYPFFYTDTTQTTGNRTYFATPIYKAITYQKKPVFYWGGVRAILDSTMAPLSINYIPVKIDPYQPVARPSAAPLPSEPKEAVIEGASDAPTTNTLEIQTYAAPPIKKAPMINDFRDSSANVLSIGQVVAVGTKQSLQPKQYVVPAFASGVTFRLANTGLAFYSFYHPFASIFVKKLNEGGVTAMLAANTAEFAEDPANGIIDPDTARKANDAGATFAGHYKPDFNYVQQYSTTDPNRNYYLENVDFSLYGTYSCYNWELFFHAPFLIATTLSKNGKYAEARDWFHTIFNPLSTETPDPNNSNSPFWRALPFKNAPLWDFTNYIQGLSAGYDNDAEIDAWRADPFNAFLIARARPIAFMKNVVMAYLDNLIQWGDDLFSTYIRENINEATQMYVLAARILGPMPQYIPQRGTTQELSYNDLTGAGLDDFGDAVVQLQNAFPNTSSVQQTDNSVPQNLLGIGQALYFCVPPNDQLLQYWTTVGDRLFKIRHGENIDGVVVPLALFQPPIDPALLLQAKAQGLDVAGILAELESPPPLYRFSYLLQKAAEFCNVVVSFGNALLSANEKQDAEQLARLRQTQEISLLNMVTEVKSRAVLEAQANLDNLNSNRATAVEKLSYYAEQLLGNAPVTVPAPPMLPDDLNDSSSLPPETVINQVTSAIDVTLSGTDESGVKVIPKENQEMGDSQNAYDWQTGASAGEVLAGVLNLIPVFKANVDPFGVGVGTSYGGPQLGAAASALSRVAQIISSSYSHSASQASRMAGFIRREQDWVFQANNTEREIVQLDKQIITAQIRLQMAHHELTNHRQQIQNSQDIEQFLENKFSNQELYDWMIDKLQDAHKQGYQLAYDMARQAEKAYQFELGITDSNFVQFGYYDDTYLGITAGEQLQLALKQMDSAYVANNTREFELTKAISLALLDPLALLQLKESGSCTINLPEAMYDLDYPGHYFRRIKSISLTIPCVAGPYTTINSTLRLQGNSIRISSLIDANNPYPQKTDGSGNPADDRFVENNIPCIAIATSFGQNDNGLFEFNFRDERYLPFEGAGAIAELELELNGKYLNSSDGTITDLSQFDYETISDAIIQIKYTAREEGDPFRQSAIANLKKVISAGPLQRLLSLRHEFPTAWNAFLNQPAANGDQTCSIQIDFMRLPYLVMKYSPTITNVSLYAATSVQLPNFHIISPAPANKENDGFSFGPAGTTFGKVMQSSNPGAQSWGANNLGIWQIVKPGNPALTAKDVHDIYVLVEYTATVT